MKKTVLITGAGGGMGQAVCRRLLELGWTVFGLDRQAPGSAENLCFIPTDLTDAASVEEACARVRQQTQHLDAIVHLAGVYDLDSLVEMDEQAITRLFQVNLFGVISGVGSGVGDASGPPSSEQPVNRPASVIDRVTAPSRR